MKKIIFFILSLSLTITLSYAEDWKATSLIGFEGVKIGAQSKHYRVYLSAKYYEINGYDTANSFGGELQYLINLSENTNFFMGVNAGRMNLKFDSPEGARSFDTPYYGFDLGANFNITDSLGFEAGTRFITLTTENTQQSVTYKLSNMVNMYMSLIFKFTME